MSKSKTRAQLREEALLREEAPEPQGWDSRAADRARLLSEPLSEAEEQALRAKYNDPRVRAVSMIWADVFRLFATLDRERSAKTRKKRRTR
jgi:hypothetical protein